LCIGASSGVTFGVKDYSTKTTIVNDSVPYLKYNYELKSRYYGAFLNTGIQYKLNLNKMGVLRLGIYANLEQKLKAKKSVYNETFGYDFNGGPVRIDSISVVEDMDGTVSLPFSYGGGFTFQSNNKQWLLGADYEFTHWNKYSYYGDGEYAHNNWVVRAGVEYYPLKTNMNSKKYMDYIKYRTGFYFGPEYIVTMNTRNNFTVTGGFSLPLTTPRYIQSRGEYVTLNTSVELGSRNNNDLQGIKENYTRINVGISMNARWFQKRSYD
jgi:hypothetical protein